MAARIGGGALPKRPAGEDGDLLTIYFGKTAPGWKISRYDPASPLVPRLMSWARLLYEICFLVSKDVRIFWKNPTDAFVEVCGQDDYESFLESSSTLIVTPSEHPRPEPETPEVGDVSRFADVIMPHLMLYWNGGTALVRPAQSLAARLRVGVAPVASAVAAMAAATAAQSAAAAPGAAAATAVGPAAGSLEQHQLLPHQQTSPPPHRTGSASGDAPVHRSAAAAAASPTTAAAATSMAVSATLAALERELDVELHLGARVEQPWQVPSWRTGGGAAALGQQQQQQQRGW